MRIRNIIQENRRDLLIIVILFTLSYGLMLLNDGVLWDDWSVYNVKDDVIINTYRMAGIPLKGLIHTLLNEYPSLYRLLTFVSCLSASLLLFCILSTIKEIDAIDRLIVILLFSLFPVNFSKISLSMTPYLTCLGLFAFGSYFLLKYIQENKIVYYLASLLFFLISFQIASFLVFFSVPFLLIIYHERMYIGFPGYLIKLKRYTFFILLPFVYWSIKQIWFLPSEIFSGYCSIHYRCILASPFNALMSVYNNLTLPITELWNNHYTLKGGYYIVLFPAYFYLYNQIKYKITLSTRNALMLFSLGLFSYFMAVFPYLATGETGFYYGLGWDSRAQLLVPLGAAIILLYGAKILFTKLQINKNILALFISLLISGFIIANMINCLEFQRAWFKQLSLIEAFKRNDIIRNNTTFLIDDQAENLNVFNAFNERIRFFEYTGMMKYAFGDEKRFAINYLDIGTIKNYKQYIKYPEYNMTNYIWKDPEYLITIKPGIPEFSLGRALKTLLFRWLDKKKYGEYINNMITIECKPLNKLELSLIEK